MRATEDGKRELSLLLEGIHCGACIWLIESWLARQPGVALASVNFATRRARIVWDPARCRLSDLLRTIAAIGYRAFPYDPARREALAQRESRALLLRLAVALLAMMQVMMFAVPTYVTVDGVEPAHRRLLEWASLTLTLPALVYSAAPFFRGAWRDLKLRRPGMDVPIALGLGAAFVGSAWATLHRRRRRLLRLGDDVHRAAALRALRRARRAPARRRRGRTRGAGTTGDGGTPRGVAGPQCRRERRRGVARRRRARAGAPGWNGPGRRRGGRRPRERRGGDPDRRSAAASEGAGGRSACGQRRARRRARGPGQRGRRGDAPGGDRAPRGARGERAAAHRAARRPDRRLVRRHAARARRADGGPLVAGRPVARRWR